MQSLPTDTAYNSETVSLSQSGASDYGKICSLARLSYDCEKGAVKKPNQNGSTEFAALSLWIDYPN